MTAPAAMTITRSHNVATTSSVVSPDVRHDRLCGRKGAAELREQFCSGHVTSTGS
jgi:hypothetical protein